MLKTGANFCCFHFAGPQLQAQTTREPFNSNTVGPDKWTGEEIAGGPGGVLE